MLIKDNRCLLYPPFDRVTELLVSKKFKKELEGTEKVITIQSSLRII